MKRVLRSLVGCALLLGVSGCIAVPGRQEKCPCPCAVVSAPPARVELACR